MVNNQTNQQWLSRSFFVFFLTWGIYLPYWSGWLAGAKGLSIKQISIIMGLALVARALATMFAFPYASKFLSNKKLITTLIISSIIVALLYIPVTSFLLLLLVTFIFSFIYPTLLPAIDSAAVTLMQQENIHYGKSRSYGSFSFILAVLGISIIVGFFGNQIILWSMFAGLGVMLLMQKLPTPLTLTIKPTIEERRRSSIKELFKNTRGFPVVLLVVVLLQGAHASYNTYGYIYLQDLKVNTFYIGLILNIAVVFEIIYFVKANNLFKNWNASALLLLSATGATLRWLLVFLFPNIWVFIATQPLHAISFGMSHYAFMQYINTSLPKQQIPNAQGFYSSLTMGLSAILITFLGGILYEIEPQFAFLGMTICTIPAIILISITRKKYIY